MIDASSCTTCNTASSAAATRRCGSATPPTASGLAFHPSDHPVDDHFPFKSTIPSSCSNNRPIGADVSIGSVAERNATPHSVSWSGRSAGGGRTGPLDTPTARRSDQRGRPSAAAIGPVPSSVAARPGRWPGCRPLRGPVGVTTKPSRATASRDPHERHPRRHRDVASRSPSMMRLRPPPMMSAMPLR